MPRGRLEPPGFTNDEHAAKTEQRAAGMVTAAGTWGRDVLIRSGRSSPSLRSWRTFSWQEKSSFALMLTVMVATSPGCRGSWARASSSFQLKKSPYSFSTMTIAVVTMITWLREDETYPPP